MKKLLTAIVFIVLPYQANAGGAADPLVSMLMLNELEHDVKGGKATNWSAQAWTGYDLNKLWLKTEGESENGNTESSEAQLLYSRAIAPYWDVQVGLRKEFLPRDSQTWGVIALQGLAPYFFEVDASLFFNDDGETALRLESEYEIMLSQRWVLAPEFEANINGFNNQARATGSGLSDVEAGLRLRYEWRREINPYIGITWEKSFGNSADFAKAEGEEISHTQFVIGLRAWY